MKRYLLNFVLCLLPALLTNQAFSENWNVDFGPFAGAGATSAGAGATSAGAGATSAGAGATSNPEKIRHVTGISLGVSRSWALSDRVSVGPMGQLVNSFVSTRSASEGKRSISSFDHRVVAAGLYAKQSFGAKQPSIFLAALVGKGMTKLAIDESSATSFLQYQNAGVPLNYSSLEAGTSIKVGDADNTVNLSILGSNYVIDQSRAVATVAGEQRSAKGIELTSGTATAAKQNLKPRANQKIAAIKLGLTMRF